MVSPMPAKLKHGVIGASGGKRPGSGRKPDAFKRAMAALVSHPKTIKFIKDIIEGKAVDEFLVLQTGVQVPVKADADTRLKYIQYAADRGMGKVSQPIEHSGDAGTRLIFMHPEDSK